MTLENRGKLPLTITLENVESPSNDGKSAFSAAPSLDVKPMSQAEYGITFSAIAAGDFYGTLYLTMNDPTQPEIQVELFGHGSPAE